VTEIWISPRACSQADRAGSLEESDWNRIRSYRPERFLRRRPGRETFLAGSWGIVKRYRGRDLAEALRDFIGARGFRSPGRREGENLADLGRAGIPVPEPRAWFQTGAESAVVMEAVDHRQTLRDRLEADPRQAREWVGPLAALVARLHESGWYHRDLYLQHLVLAGESDPRLVLIDVGRARHGSRIRRRWWIKDLAALLHSTPDGVAARTRLRFLAAYCDARGVTEREERRSWARAVLAKAKRMAAHVPLEHRAPC